MEGRRDCTAVVAGHICLDVIPDLSTLPRGRLDVLFRPGRLLEVGPVTFSTGGAVSNTGLALNKLGIPTQLMGKIGDDMLGQAVQQIVSSHGGHLTGGMVVDETADTSYTIIINPPDIDRIFLHCPGANDTFGADDVRYDVVAQARLFHLGYPPVMKRMFEANGAELIEIFRRVKDLGVTTSLDMALPDPNSAAGRADWAAIVQAVMPYVDIFLPSIEEILYMVRRETYDDLCHSSMKGSEAAHSSMKGSEAAHSAGEAGPLAAVTPALLSDLGSQLLEMGGTVVGFKLGDRGLYLRTAGQAAIESLGQARPSDPAAWADKELWAPCFQVDVVGTTGAGDATIAGFLGALLRDMPAEAALTAAVAVGACNVEASDALSGIQPWDETTERLDSGWARHHMDVAAPRWRFDAHHQLWVGPGDGGR